VSPLESPALVEVAREALRHRGANAVLLRADSGADLRLLLRLGDMVDQGTGSTFSALADRCPVNVQWHRVDVRGQGVPHLRMTTNGQALQVPDWREGVQGAAIWHAEGVVLARFGESLRRGQYWAETRIRRLRPYR